MDTNSTFENELKAEEPIEEISHEVTSEEIKENGLEDVLTPGEEIKIPSEDIPEVEAEIINPIE